MGSLPGGQVILVLSLQVSLPTPPQFGFLHSVYYWNSAKQDHAQAAPMLQKEHVKMQPLICSNGILSDNTRIYWSCRGKEELTGVTDGCSADVLEARVGVTM
ncbi:UNVERIFIED_CONTAM: hypothetical protein K2H54_055460 [Gekko kuhli]